MNGITHSEDVRNNQTRRRLRLTTALSTMLSTVLGALPAGPAAADPAAMARPVGGTVVGGAATIARTASDTRVTQSSARAVIDWTGFDIGASQSVTFAQPGARSVVLNRVTTPEPSQIAGRISANGQVVIENRSGVVFTGSAQVDAQALVVSAAGITNGAFMAGGTTFDIPARVGAEVVNRGRITVREAGLVALVAPGVSNSGTIVARAGRVILGGAETHTVDLYGDGLLSIETKAVGATVRNTGTVSADGGQVLLTAAQADGVVTGLVEAGGRISARTTKAGAGRVSIQSTGGSVVVDGQILATGRTGGTIDIAATGTVSLAAGARVSANGARGGGRVAIGQAAGMTAAVSEITSGARVSADATRDGAGGAVRVMSASQTTLGGAISARGGSAGGAGGTVEVSGARGLALTGTIDVGAVRGEMGTILIDPQDLVIQAGGGAALFAPVGASGTLAVGNNGGSPTPVLATLDPEVIASLTGKVVLQAARDLTVQSALTSPAASLTLQAGRNLTLNAPVNLAGAGTLSLAAAVSAFAGQPGYDAVGGPSGSLSIASTGGIGAAAALVSISAGSGGVIANAAITASRLTLTTTGGGAISVPTSIITAGTLGITQAGAVTLTGANRIAVLDGIQASGAISVRDSQALLVQTAVAAASAGSGITLRSTDAIHLAPGASVTADGLVIMVAQPAAGAGTGSIWLQGGVTSTHGAVLIAAGLGGLTIGAPIAAGSGQVLSLIGDSYSNASPATNTLVAPGGTIALAPFTAGAAMTLGAGGGLALAGTTGMTASVLIPGGLVVPGAAPVAVAGSIVVAGFDASGIPVLRLMARTTVTQTAPLSHVARLDIDAASVTLGAANSITALGTITTSGDARLSNATGLLITGPVAAANLRLEVDGGLTIGQSGTPGSLSGGNVALIVSGAISEPNGSITAALLTGPQAGAIYPHAASVQLRGNNSIAVLGGFSVLGDFGLANAIDLGVSGGISAGSVPAPNAANTSTIELVVSGGLTLGPAGGFGALNAGRVNLLASGTIAEPAGLIRANVLSGPGPGLAVATAASVTLDAGNRFSTLGGFTSSGNLVIRDAQAITVAGTLHAGSGAGTSVGNTATLELDTPGDLRIGTPSVGAMLNGGTVALVAGGSISQPNGLLIAGTLLGPGPGAEVAQAASVRLDGVNFINRLGRFVTAGDFSLADSWGLAVTGSVTAGATLGLVAGGDLTIGLPGSAAVVSATMVSLVASGTIAEQANGAVVADLLSGPGAATPYSAAAAVSLTGANTIARLGGFVSSGNLVLRDQTGLTVVGDLSAGGSAAPGPVNVSTLGLAVLGDLVLGTAVSPVRLNGGTVGLGASGTVSEPFGVISANLLTDFRLPGATVTAQRIDLTASNNVAAIGDLVSLGDIAITTSAALLIAGTVSAGGILAPDPANTGHLTLTTPGDLGIGTTGRPGVLIGGTVTLATPARITEPNGAIDTNLLLIPAPIPSLALGGVNTIAQLGPIAATGDLLVKSGGTMKVAGPLQAGGTITLGGGGDLLLAAPVSASDVILASTGTISEAGGIITANRLGGIGVGVANLSAGNSIATLGDFTATGSVTLNDVTALDVAGRVSLGAAATLTLHAGGPLRIGGTIDSGNVVLLSAGDIFERVGGRIVTGLLSGPNPLAGVASTTGVTLTGNNGIAALGPFTTTGDFLLTNAAGLTIAGSIVARDLALPPATPQPRIAIAVTSGGLAIGAPATPGELDAAVVAVAARAGITEPNGRIVASLLTDQTGLAGSPVSSSIALTGANVVTTLGAMTTAPGALALTTTGPLTLAGPVNGAGGVTLTAGGALNLAGDIVSAGTVSLNSLGADVIQTTGSLVAAGLAGSARGALLVEITTNRIDSIGGMKAGARIAVIDAIPLAVTGALAVDADGAIGLTAPTLALGGVITAPGTSGLLTLSATSGAITQTGGGLAVTVLSGTAARGIALDTPAAANRIGVVATLVAAGGTLGLANVTPMLVGGTVRGIGAVSLSGGNDLVLGPAAVVTTNLPAEGQSVSFTSSEANTGSVVLTAGRNLSLQPGALARGDFVAATAAGGVFENGEIVGNRIFLGGPGGGAAGLVVLGNGAWLMSGGVGPFNGALPLSRWPTLGGVAGGTFISTVNFSITGTAMLADTWGQPAPLLRLDIAGAGTMDNAGGLWAKTGTVFINMGRNATLSGNVDANALYVAYPRSGSGSAELLGSVRGISGQAAAQLAFIQPSPSAVYRLNACAIASVSCFVVSTERLPQTVPTRDLDIRPARDESDDTEVLLPNVSRRDF